MNESQHPEPVSPLAPAAAGARPAPPEPDWFRRFLACNPFYLVSVALLLFGVSRLTRDPRFLTTETGEVLMKFGVLHAYGFLLVGTASWLIRRRVRYDSALLVVLENGLLLAPFLVISQAVLLDVGLAWTLAVSGGLAVAVRSWAVRRWYPEFNLPDGFRWAGLAVVVLNLALPLVYRTRVDTDWHVGNRVVWLGVMPALALVPLLLPRTRRWDGTECGVSWLPSLLHALWIAGSGVHAWSIAWVDKTPMPVSLVVPAAMAMLALWNGRHADFGPGPNTVLRAALLSGVTLLALGAPGSVPTALGTMGAGLVYLVLFALLSGPAVMALRVGAGIGAGLLAVRGAFLLAPGAGAWLTRPEVIATAMGGLAGSYLLYRVVRSRNPMAGVLGGLLVVPALWLLMGREPSHWPVVGGCLFALLHSLRWVEGRRGEALVGRAFVGVIWVSDSAVWSLDGGMPASWAPFWVGLGLVAALAGWRRFTGMRVPWELFFIAGLNALVPAGAGAAATVPVSVLLLGVSLATFAAGTWLAVRSRRDGEGTTG